MKKFTVLIVTLFQCFYSFAQESIPVAGDTIAPPDSLDQTVVLNEFVLGSEDQQKAAMLLNECIYTLTKVRLANNRLALEEEQFKLNNVLTWEGISSYRTISDFRRSLNTELNGFVISSIEKERYQKAFDKKKNNAARDAFLGAISGVQINVNLVSVISNVVLSSARALMDYNVKMDEYADELDEQMWVLKKEELNSITRLRNEAFDVLDETFGEHGLKESMRLTEKNVEDFFDILNKKDLIIKSNLLLDKESVYQFFPPYWYERGCAFMDLFENTQNKDYLSKAWTSFDRYEQMSNKFRLYRYDSNLGMIALFKLQYMNDLSEGQKLELIDEVTTNIKDNGNAYLFCALQYLSLNKVSDAFNLLAHCLTNNQMTTKDEMLLAAAASWNMLKDKDIKDYFTRALGEAERIGINAYVSFMYAVRNDKDVDYYLLQRALQKGIALVPISYNKGDIKEIQCQQNTEKFVYRIDDWNLVRWDFYNDSDDNTQWNASVRYATHSLKNKEKYFESKEDMAHEMYYFKDHPDHLKDLPSKVKIDGKEYYYLDAAKDWDKGVVKYYTAQIESDQKSKAYGKEKNKREKKYREFYKKYSVSKIESVFEFEHSKSKDVKEQHAVGYYTGPICILKVIIDSGDICDAKLQFETDYIEEGKTMLRFCGIWFGEEYFKF